MARSRKKRGTAIDGVLLLDKPSGITSNKALQICRALINAKKAGHTGALDPLATGLLPLCFGEATKFSSFLLGSDKSYQVTIKLGEVTDTADAEGKVIQSRDVHCDEQAVQAALTHFIGEYKQMPPMYSALKVNGQPLYKLARKGLEVERKARTVTAHGIRFIAFDGEREIRFEVDCSSGFYVRSLAQDIGEQLGCGAHVAQLRRTRVANLSIDQAIDLEAFEALPGIPERLKKILPSDVFLQNFSAEQLNEAQKAALFLGQPVGLEGERRAPSADNDFMRVYGPDNAFLGLGKIDVQGKLAPKRLIANPENRG